MLIDDREHKVHLLDVASGGFLGLGQTKVLIPIDAITKIDEQVHINHTREHVAHAPMYDPDLVADPHYLDGIYGHYGYSPFWGPGYMYPLFPYY